MAATRQVAREAWRIFVNQSRTDLYDHMDRLHRIMAGGHWRSYDGNRDRYTGPFELNQIDWYRRNKNWGHWLRRVNKWATEAIAEVVRLVARLENLCTLGVLLFRCEKECAVDDTLYLAMEETKEVLKCFRDGWHRTLCNMTLTEWCSMGSLEQR